MEYVPGGTLKERILREVTLPPHAAAAVALRVAEALGFAHQRGLVHRDAKPQSVLLTTFGEAKVADFGIARAESSGTITETGLAMGTAHYISPEQAMKRIEKLEKNLRCLGATRRRRRTARGPSRETALVPCDNLPEEGEEC